MAIDVLNPARPSTLDTSAGSAPGPRCRYHTLQFGYNNHFMTSPF